MKIKKIIITLLLIIVTSTAMPSVVHAGPTPTFSGKYTRGITRISFWLDYSSGVGAYETLIKSAKSNWENPGWANPIYMVAASSNWGTMLDFYCAGHDRWGSYLLKILGETYHYNSAGTYLVNSTVNYYFTRIYLNNEEFSLPEYDNTDIRSVIIHEMGHALGLAHNFSTSVTIMNKFQGRSVSTVQQVDNTAVVNHYN